MFIQLFLNIKVNSYGFRFFFTENTSNVFSQATVKFLNNYFTVSIKYKQRGFKVFTTCRLYMNDTACADAVIYI